MGNCCGVGALSKLAIGLASGTPTRMDFVNFSAQIVRTLSDGSTRAIRGTLDHINTDVATGLLHIKFRTTMLMTSAKMDVLLPCLGFTTSPTPWTIGDSLPLTTVVVGPSGSSYEDTYVNCVPTDFVITGQKGDSPVMIDIGWVAQSWTQATAGTFFVSQTSPAMTEGYIYPFAAQGTGNASTLNLLGQSLAFPMFRLKMDYKVVVEFNNSTTATNLCPTDHELTFSTSALYTNCDGNQALWNAASGPASGDTTGASLTLNLQRTVSSTAYQTQFVVANAKLLARAPNIVKNDFIRLPVNVVGYATSGTPLLVVTNQP